MMANDQPADDQPPGGALTRPPRVAFIDDDEDLLAGLRRALWGLGLGWEMLFFSAPREALAALI
ncbi:MAG: hypothetical protein ACK5VP_09095, partial [Betaproteobacteria bacterium]